MAEEKKKTKIDLKARLGKTQSGPGSVPLPVPGAAPSSQPGASAPPSADGVPPPVVPAPTPSVRPSVPGVTPGLSPGIPLPPFAQPRPSQREAPAKPTAAQQTIKVEVGEEVHEERKKANKRAILFSAIAAVLGLAIGFVVGGAQERSARGQLAQKAAGELEKEVKSANEKLDDLGKKLTEANEKLGKKEYPTELAGALGGLNIPFESTNLEKPGTGTLPVLKSLIKYASAAQELNETKDKLKNLLSGAQTGVEKSWKEEKEPVVNYSVIFRPEGGKGMVAELVPNKDPFKLGAEFPKEYTITKPEMVQGQLKGVEKKAKRWDKGDLTGSDPIAIPVSPQTMAGFSEKAIGALRLALIKPLEIIYGENKGTPQETEGLLKDGENLAIALQKIKNAK
jgi:hypothetical protein